MACFSTLVLRNVVFASLRGIVSQNGVLLVIHLLFGSSMSCKAPDRPSNGSGSGTELGTRLPFPPLAHG
jgi:hypothetical protein